MKKHGLWRFGVLLGPRHGRDPRKKLPPVVRAGHSSLADAPFPRWHNPPRGHYALLDATFKTHDTMPHTPTTVLLQFSFAPSHQPTEAGMHSSSSSVAHYISLRLVRRILPQVGFRRILVGFKLVT